MSTHKYWTVDPTECLELRMGTEGAAAWTPRTMPQMFEEAVEKNRTGKAIAAKVKNSEGIVSEEWKFWTWEEYYNDCHRFAQSLVSLGVEVHGVVNIIGFNAPAWFIANNGTILGGSISAGIYTTNTPDACLYVSRHSKAEVLVVENNKQLQKYASCPDLSKELPLLKAIVMYGEDVDESLLHAVSPIPVHSFESFLDLGKSISAEVIKGRNQQVMPGHCALLIYTSGTTGPPKGAMVSHDNITFTAKNTMESFVDFNSTERTVSYLPLSHIAGQVIDIFCPMHLASCTYFAQPDALKGSLTTTLKEVKPTIFFGVPRVWEKIQEKMAAIARQTTGIKRSISSWAKSLGAAQMKEAQFGKSGSLPWGYGCANSLVLSKVKAALGLEAAKLCCTGAAPISTETLEYFGSLGINIYEGFGQSECGGLYSMNAPGMWKVGSCGRPIPGSHAKIDEVNGELCYTGRHIFMGYLYEPGKTQETIDDEGYLHSGDVAVFDDDNDPRVPSPSGFLRITGRIKELIITAGGENIPPVLIENEMKSVMPELSTCLVIGDRRKFLSMLVALQCEVNPETGEPTDQLASESLSVCKRIGSSAKTMSEAAVDPAWEKHITEGMKQGNAKTTSNAQIVQKWKMLPVDLSEGAGDLTPTLKIKRHAVYEKYSALTDSIYDDAAV